MIDRVTPCYFPVISREIVCREGLVCGGVAILDDDPRVVFLV